MKKLGHTLLPVTAPTRPDRGSAVVSMLDTLNSSHQCTLSPALSYILEEVQREQALVENQDEGNEARALLVDRVAEKIGFALSRHERDEVLSFMERSDTPFGILQPLVDDPTVSDIIVSCYSKIGVQQGRRNFSSSLTFADQESYEGFVERVLMRAGATYSTKKPIADGMIGSYARVHAVHKSICDSGPYLTIRVNRFSKVTIDTLIEAGLAPQEIFSYLKAVVGLGKTVLVVGEVGTGKTTLTRALAGSLPSDESILVIEDTPEIRLEHPHVRYLTTREANSDGAGRLSPSQCIRAGMRMAMNRIIFGEMRDAEAAEAFVDVCASGHPGLSTIHARSAAEAIARLELFLGRAQPGTSRSVLSEEIATAVQVIVFVSICSDTGKRRIVEVQEVGPVADGVVRHREIFRYGVKNRLPRWSLVTRVSGFREALETLEVPVRLAQYPSTLELPLASLYQESISARR